MSFQALNSIGREPDVKLLYNVSFGAHEGSAPFARCRDIDEDIKADLIQLLYRFYPFADYGYINRVAAFADLQQ